MASRPGLRPTVRLHALESRTEKTIFIPDLPKAYQTSQYDLPLCVNGRVDFTLNGERKTSVRLTRIHIEEDAGKLLHDAVQGNTLVDYNRCGVPLIEIVTEPDIRSAEEAREFLETLKSILEYTAVSDRKMQEGARWRCDVWNVCRKADGAEGVRHAYGDEERQLVQRRLPRD